MVYQQEVETTRVNARRTDAFDLFNFKHYAGPNPYLSTAAYVFDFALTGTASPRSLDVYLDAVSDRYPHLADEPYDCYAHLFARTVAEVNKLEMDTHFEQWSMQSMSDRSTRIAIQTLHATTSHAVAYGVWDWFESITQDHPFSMTDQMRVLQNLYRNSVYGGPTVYALLKTAHTMDIPTFYLWDEGLMQYGYGKKHVRGIATTFDVDSHLDSDFTTRKNDCKRFLETVGFPVPSGEIVYTLSEAVSAARRIGFPVAVKPVVGHKGIGVTADVQDEDELEQAFERALQATVPDQSSQIIVERSITGKDYRLLCVNGRFVAATERSPAWVVGDGRSTIQELIDRENRTPARLDTPTSPMGQIKCDDAMRLYLKEQRLQLDSILDPGEKVYLRKVANLSAGGVSIDATHAIHPDNMILAQDIAQYFRLTCLGIDVISPDLSQSWKEGRFSILEINAAPGIFMHLKPAIGESVDVPNAILKTFFASGDDARIPVITINHLETKDLQAMVDTILSHHSDWMVGAVTRQGVWMNRSPKAMDAQYNTNVQNLLRHPRLDVLIAEYPEEILYREGMFCDRSNLVILNNPTEVEKGLVQTLVEQGTIVIHEQGNISIHRNGLVEQYPMGEDEAFSHVYQRELMTIL